jgi:hypothetical protein
MSEVHYPLDKRPAGEAAIDLSTRPAGTARLSANKESWRERLDVLPIRTQSYESAQEFEEFHATRPDRGEADEASLGAMR